MKKLMLIVNPYSGRGLANNTLGTIVSLFCKECYTVTVYTTACGSPEELAREYAESYDLVVCVGGDGTVSGVASGLMRTASPPPFGFIPAGTANDMASTLALPRDPAAAVKAVLRGQPIPMDIGSFNDQYFTYIAAFGAFTGVSYSTPQNAKRALGHLAYVLGGLATLTTIRPQHTVITYDGGTLEGDYIFGGVTNSTTIAGFVKLDCKDVDLGDGQFEVILVKNPVNAAELGNIIASILNQTYQSENVLLLHTKKITFMFDEDVVWTKDGEFGGKHRALEIEIRRHALRIIV
jgi:YegS/Rv2252/BmrU family lipid kinase